MSNNRPRIGIPVPTSIDTAYNDRSWPLYARAVEQAGGEPIKVSLTDAVDGQAQVIAECAGVLLPGSRADINPEKYGQAKEPECGPSDQAREAADELILQDAFHLRKPILGICYGMQSLNVWKGGSLVQHLPYSGISHQAGHEVARAHAITVASGSWFGHMLATIPEKEPGCWVNSSHHQAVSVPGDGLRPSVWSTPDGVIEAIEGTSGQFVLGLQWHPERTTKIDQTSERLFEEFIAAARQWNKEFHAKAR